jgi:Domain of unknown function (DUF5597)
LVAGQATLFDFDSERAIVEIDEVRELMLTDEKLCPARLMNGDERDC